MRDAPFFFRVEKHAILAGWPSHLTSLALMLGLGGAAGLLYLLLTKWLGLSEPLYIARLFSRRRPPAE